MKRRVNTNWLPVNHSDLMSGPDRGGALHHSSRLHSAKGCRETTFCSYLHSVCSGCWTSAWDRGSRAGACAECVYLQHLWGWWAWQWARTEQTLRQKCLLSDHLSADAPNGYQKTWSTFWTLFHSVFVMNLQFPHDLLPLCLRVLIRS